jgi:hypothetical protein
MGMQAMSNRLKLRILAFFLLAAFLIILPSSILAETLKWDASSGKVEGYKIYWGTNKYKPTNSRDVGKRRAYNLNKLPLAEGVTYYLSVSAYNQAGESKRSTPVVFKPGDNTPPAPPRGFKAY